MAERGQAGVEADLAARQRPALRAPASMLDPAAAAFLVRAGDEGRVGRPVVERRRPHRLRFGADDGDRAIALPLAAVAAVDQPPVVPRLGDDGLEFGRGSCRQRDLAADRGDRARARQHRLRRRRAPRRHRPREARPSISSRVMIRPKISIERAIESARPCGVSSAISSPASTCARARFSSASLRSSAARSTRVAGQRHRLGGASPCRSTD